MAEASQFDTRHSLITQTHDHYLPHLSETWKLDKLYSAMQRNSVVNADGFGVGWYVDDEPEPCIFTRYVASRYFPLFTIMTFYINI